MNVVLGMSRNSHCSQLGSVTKLPMTAPCPNDFPSVSFQQPDEISGNLSIMSCWNNG